jgi:type II secretory ATPase GspE/PulE/Tfp pilus assembly ATPase PilB-like protein
MVERLYSAAQVAGLLGATAPVIQEWVRRGWLEATQLPEQPMRISESALVRFLKDRGIDVPGIAEKVLREEPADCRPVIERPRARQTSASTDRPAPVSAGRPAAATSVSAGAAPAAGTPSPRMAGASSPRAAAAPVPPATSASVPHAARVSAATPHTAAGRGENFKSSTAAPVAGSPTSSARSVAGDDVTQPASVSAAAVASAAGGDGEDAGPAIRTAQQVIAAILEDAVRRRATAIHLEAGTDGLALHLRVDGRVYEKKNFRARLPRGLAPLVLTKCKGMAGLDPAERRLPQYGRMSMRIASRDVVLHVAACPTADGERLVIYVRPRSAPGLEAIGLAREPLAIVHRMLAAPGGLIVAVAPNRAACAKMLGAMSAAMEAAGRCVVAVMRGPPVGPTVARQIVAATEGGPGAGLSAAAAVSAATGQDADAIVIDDIGDRATLVAVLEAARTGPLVLAGLVSRRPEANPAALAEAGADPLALSTMLVGMLASRTVRRICDHCRAPAAADPQLAERLSAGRIADDLPTWAGRGCPQCGGTGFRGEAALYEAMHVDAQVARLIAAGADAGDIDEAARAAGSHTLSDSAIEAIRRGATTVEEAARVLEVAE